MRLPSEFKFKMLIRHINDFQIATAPCQKYTNSTSLRTEKCHSTNDLKIGTLKTLHQLYLANAHLRAR